MEDIKFDEIIIDDGENEVGPELLGLHALFPLALYDSTTRSQMASSMFQQRVVLDDPDAQRIVSGFDMKMAKHLNDVRMPENGIIKKIIEMYPRNYGELQFNTSPYALAIYENEDGKLDCFEITNYKTNHPEFGYKLHNRPAINKLTPGNWVEKDTVFKSSSSLGENGEFKFGVRAKTAHINSMGASEDALVMRKGFADKLRFRMYKKISIGMGTEHYPLNIYGTKDRYQPFPNIGEYIRDDGLIMALREYKPEMSPALMHPESLMDPDPVFDHMRYLKPNPKRPGETKDSPAKMQSRGKVVFIRVFRNPGHNPKLPAQFTGQLEAYHRAYVTYLKELVEFDQHTQAQYRRDYGSDAKPYYGAKLQALIAKAYAMLIAYGEYKPRNAKNIARTRFVDKKVVYDEWTVEMVVEYTITPTVGFKFTGLHGDKGVVCHIVDDDKMLRDRFGRVADIEAYGASTVNRMCVGRAYELYLNDALEQIEMKVRSMFGLDPLKPTKMDIEDFIGSYPKDKITQAFEYIKGFYRIINPAQHAFYDQLDFAGYVQVVHGAITDSLTLHLPQDIPIKLYKAIQVIEKSPYKPIVDHLRAVDDNGNIVETIKPIAIADQYMMALNKIGNAWNSVDVPLLQSHGVISSITESEKISNPYRPGAVRIIGEAESNIIAAIAGPEALVELHDRSTSIDSMRESVRTLLRADQPNNIEELIDRDKVPYGRGRPLQIFHHKLSCYGVELAYVEEKPKEDK